MISQMPLQQDGSVDVSVILVNFNTRVLTMQCLSSIFEQTRDVAYEVLVVDNHSTDGSIEAIREGFPHVIVIENESNIGFGKANNRGIQRARGKYVFFLNTDTLLLNNVVKLFYDFMETHTALPLGCIGGVLLDEKMNKTHSSGPFPNKWMPIKSQFIGYFSKKFVVNLLNKELSRYSEEKVYIEVDYVTGADIFAAKSVIEKFGGFDPMFFMYFEESDLQNRMHEQGYVNVIIHGPKIVHIQGSSDPHSVFSPVKRTMNDKSMFYYFRKRSTVFGYLLFRIGYFLVKLPLMIDRRVPFAERLAYQRFLLTYKPLKILK